MLGLRRVTHSLLRAGPDTLAQSAYSPDRVRGSPLEPLRRQSLRLASDSKAPLTCGNVGIPTIPVSQTTHTNGPGPLSGFEPADLGPGPLQRAFYVKALDNHPVPWLTPVGQ